jgi:predicted transcriptional regulator of viral defense system
MLSGFLDRLDLGRLVAYALRYDVGAVIKRLGWTLETLGVPADQLQPLRDYLASSAYLAEPSAPGPGVLVSRWRVRDNLSMRSAHGNR